MSEADTAAISSAIVAGGWGVGLLIGVAYGWLEERREREKASEESEAASAIFEKFVRESGK